MSVSKLLLSIMFLAVAPFASQTAAARPACAPDATWAFLDGTVAAVRVWYDQGSPADLAQAQAMVAALDGAIWPTLISGLGFTAPQSDLALACDGGDGRQDIFVVAGLGARGETFQESGTDFQGSTYIEIRSGLAGQELLYATTHYFMHAVQWAYVMVAPQLSYGWMRNALANWAVEAVYPGNPTLLADASCHMNSTFLPIDAASTGACLGDVTRTRDYGAYLLYQYIGRTAGNPKVRELLAATATSPTALNAIEVNVVGGLRTLWPRFSKTLWNKMPVAMRHRNAFRSWDGLTAVPAYAPDHPTSVNADLAGIRAATTSLDPSVENASTRFYRFTFTDVGTRSLMFHNTFYPLFKAGRKVTVQAMWRTEGGAWVEEDWTAKEWIGLCRDAKNQRVAEIIVVIASGEVGPVTQVVAAKPATMKRNNIGCWAFSGPVKRTEIHSSWSSGTIVASGTALFDYKPNGFATTQYNDPATGRLRVPIASPLFRRIIWNLAEGYTENACSYSLTASGNDSTIVLGGLAFGTMVINNFAESLPASVRTSQQGVVGSTRGAYSLQTGSQRFGILGSVSGPQPGCGTLYASAPGMFLLTNITPAGAPVITQSGRLKGSYVFSAVPDSIVFEWDLEPLREP